MAMRGILRSDVAVSSDTSQYAPNLPAGIYGLRGITQIVHSRTNEDASESV
jgi:hypothetical protein